MSNQGDIVFTFESPREDLPSRFFETVRTRVGSDQPFEVLMRSTDSTSPFPSGTFFDLPEIFFLDNSGFRPLRGSTSFNNQGDLALWEVFFPTAGDLGTNYRVRTITGDESRTVVNTQEAAVGAPGFVHATLLFPQRLDTGETAFSSFLLSDDGETGSFGVWLDDGATQRPVVLLGASAPGTDNNFSRLFVPEYNAQGHIAFTGTLQPLPGDSSASLRGVWGGPIEAPVLIARGGDESPGSGGATYREFLDFSVQDDTVTFVSRLRRQSGIVENTNDTGIWSYRAGTVRELLREGAPVAGLAGIEVGNITEAVALTDEFFVFEAELRNAGEGAPPVTAADDEALFLHRESASRVLLREGDAVAGFDDRSVISFDPISINASGDLAFTAPIDTPDDGFRNALYAYDSAADALRLIAAAGQQIEVAGQMRTIQSISYNLENGLADTGLLGYTLQFTDDTYAVFTQFVPAPGAIALFGLAALGHRRRR